MTEIDVNMTPTGSIIFYLSVAATFVTAFNAYINPGGRWRQIRETTCHLESAIWQYRTRTGPFKIQRHETDKSAIFLKTEVVHAVETLIGSSDIGQSTSWSKLYSKSVYKHGQYESLQVQKSPSGILILSRKTCLSGLLSWSKRRWADLLTLLQPTKVYPGPVSPPVDDHHSPLTPENYILFRLTGVMNFYKGRLPNYTRSRNLLSVLLMTVTAAGTILAYKKYSDYVSICSAIAAAITSWMEYNNITTKIGRYNGVVSSLESLILWWSSLPEVDKNVITNIDDLVTKGEQVTLSIHKRRFTLACLCINSFLCCLFLGET